MPDLTTKDALLERMAAATEELATDVPSKFDEYLPLSGGTMTGPIKGNPLTLTADDGNGNTASLVLNSDGSAQWNEKNVATTNVDTTTVSAAPVGDGVFAISKVGGVGFLYLSNITNLPASQFTSVTAVLPVGYRPSYNFVKTITLISGSTSRSNIVVRIQTDGTVSFYNYGAVVADTQLCYEMISYPIGG